jgi:hypothetical protein
LPAAGPRRDGRQPRVGGRAAALPMPTHLKIATQRLVSIVAILVENTFLKDSALYEQMGTAYLNPDCYLNVDAMQWDLDWYASNGFVAQRPNLLQTLDNSYCDYAIQQLGRYQP